MKKLIVLSIIMAIILLVAVIVHAQAPANDLKPTFISPTPGLYVNGWPAFTVSYPKEWVEIPPPPGGVLQVGAPRPDLGPGVYAPQLSIIVWVSPRPLEDTVKEFMPVWVEYFTGIKILSDPFQLKDGTPAWEVETEWVLKRTGLKENAFLLVAKKDVTWVGILLITDGGKLDEDVKKIAYSLSFQPDREKPVQVPPDVRAFLDMYCSDMMGHDAKAFMEHYSDRFLWTGSSKAYMEQWFRNDPFSPRQRGIISNEATVTVFEPHGDKAYVD